MVCNSEDVDLKPVSEVRGQQLQINAERDEQRDKNWKKKTDNSAMNISSSYSGDLFTRQSVSGLQK